MKQYVEKGEEEKYKCIIKRDKFHGFIIYIQENAENSKFVSSGMEQQWSMVNPAAQNRILPRIAHTTIQSKKKINAEPAKGKDP